MSTHRVDLAWGVGARQQHNPERDNARFGTHVRKTQLPFPARSFCSRDASESAADGAVNELTNGAGIQFPQEKTLSKRLAHDGRTGIWQSHPSQQDRRRSRRDRCRPPRVHAARRLALTGIVAWAAAQYGLYQAIADTPFLWVVLLAPLGIALLLGFGFEGLSSRTAQAMFWIYAALMGLSLAGIFLVYTNESIARVFFITAATFAAMSLYGYTTGSDPSGVGSFLFMGLVGILIAGLVNIFLQSPALHFALSVIGVVVLVGLTAYDTQRIKEFYWEGDDEEAAAKKAVFGALALYLDFVNLFLHLLQFLGQRNED